MRSNRPPARPLGVHPDPVRPVAADASPDKFRPLTADPESCAAASSTGRLLIHPTDNTEARSALAEAAKRLRALARANLQRFLPAPISMQIDGLQGRRFFVTEDAQPPIEILLPAGTYHVSARQSTLRRRYTVTLEQGATLHLHLRLK